MVPESVVEEWRLAMLRRLGPVWRLSVRALRVARWIAGSTGRGPCFLLSVGSVPADLDITVYSITEKVNSENCNIFTHKLLVLNGMERTPHDGGSGGMDRGKPPYINDLRRLRTL